jgi:hypothetical protein
MRSIDGQLSKLEHRLGVTRNAPRYLLVLRDARREYGPADDAYIKSLDEAGLLPTSGFAMVDLSNRPDAVTTEKTKRHDGKRSGQCFEIKLEQD